VFILYSVISVNYNRWTFDQIPRVYSEVVKIAEGFSNKPSLILRLVGNKNDGAPRVISQAEGQALAQDLGCEMFETSRNTAVRDLDEVFTGIIRTLRERHRAASLEAMVAQRVGAWRRLALFVQRMFMRKRGSDDAA
jgi:hypothetical protein